MLIGCFGDFSNIYLENNIVMRLPNPDKTEVFVMRISLKHKQQLQELAKKSKFKNNTSEVVRDLIEAAYARR